MSIDCDVLEPIIKSPRMSLGDATNNKFTYYPSKGKVFNVLTGDTYLLRQLLDDLPDDDIREEARKCIADFSNTVLTTTGKKVYESLEYKGISTWWFLEIILHEPFFLHMRTQKILMDLKKINVHAHLSHNNLQPNVLKTIVTGQKHRKFSRLSNTRVIKRIKNISTLKLSRLGIRIIKGIKFRFKNISTLFFSNHIKYAISKFILMSSTPKDILFVFEHENLRRHLNIQKDVYLNTLPYAEDIAENLNERLGKRIAILNRNLNFSKDGWEPMTGGISIYPLKKLPKHVKDVIAEIYSLLPREIRSHYLLPEIQSILASKRSEIDFYFDLLDKIKPKVIFSYNWEGVFRTLVATARAKNIKVVGIQQALGPYSHALNHQETGYWTQNNQQTQMFPIPDKLVLWGDFHKEQLIRYGYPSDNLVVTGYSRLDRHYKSNKNKQAHRQAVAKILDLDPDKKYLLFTVQYKVLNTCLVNETDFKDTLIRIIQLADIHDFYIIIKPWSGDDMSFLLEQAAQRPDRIFFAPQNIVVTNADLLTLTDWCVSTFSSIIGEATLSDNLCFLIHYPESTSYFEEKHMRVYDPFTIKIKNPNDLTEKLPPYICSEAMKDIKIAQFKKHLEPIFGPCDGEAANRIVNEIVALIE